METTEMKDKTSETFGSVATVASFDRAMLVAGGLFGVGFFLLYFGTFKRTVAMWQGSDGGHGPLILLVSLYLVWISRDELRRMTVKPALIPGTVSLLLGCFMLFAGKLSNTFLLQQVSIVPTVFGGLWLLLGSAQVRLLFLPVIYLLFLTGLVEELLGNLNLFLQTTSAWIAAKMLILTGMPVVLNGIVVDLPHISMIVIKACSGINHLVALMALSVPLGMLNNLTFARKCFLFVASFFIGLFANGLRIAAIGYYSLYNPGVNIHGPDQTLYVGALFFIGMIFLIMLGHVLKSKPVGIAASTQEDAIVDNHERSSELLDHPVAGQSGQITKSDRRNGTSVVPVVVAGVIFLVTLVLMNFYEPQPVPLTSSLDSLPQELAGLTGKNLEWMDTRMRPYPADDELQRIYVDGSGRRMELYVGYFADQYRGRRIIDYRRNWLHDHAVEYRVNTETGPITINRTQDIEDLDSATRADIYFWYVVDDRVFTSRYIGKLKAFIDAMFKGKTNAALVIVQTRSDEESATNFVRELLPLLDDVLVGE